MTISVDIVKENGEFVAHIYPHGREGGGGYYKCYRHENGMWWTSFKRVDYTHMDAIQHAYENFVASLIVS